MKKNIYNYLLAGVAMVSLAGCNDFLDDNRYPLDKMVDSPIYWTSEQNLITQVDPLLNNYTGYGQGASWVNDFYYQSLSDDQCTRIQSGGIGFSKWTYESVPTANSVWDASYVQIRRCNTVINKANLANEIKNNNYIGIARLNRAMQYYDLVRNLGDVPLVTTVLNTDSPELYGERTPRNEVMDFVLEDLNFAINHIIEKSSKIYWCVDLALALKSEICLYEAAYAKYHQSNAERANKFYNEVVNACTALMSRGYSIGSDYRAIYNSYFDEDKALGIPSLRNNPEIIFMKGYQVGGLTHSAVNFLSAETTICGMTKDAFDSYLFKDAKPKALTSYPTTDLPEITEDGEFSIAHMLEVRDGRLAQTIDDQLGFGNVVNFKRSNSDFIRSSTGYTIKKYVNPNSPGSQTLNANTNLTCAPIYWLAFTFCDYLEAKAELGQLSDADVTNCVKPLWDRAGIDTSNLSKAYLEGMNDPANNMGVSSLIWEIRRLRRSELMFDRNHRYWDLVRWHQLDKLDTAKNPDIVLGANVTGADAEQLSSVFTNAQNYINAAQTGNGTNTRVFTEREYLQPLGSQIISLYTEKGLKLEQNPGWK